MPTSQPHQISTIIEIIMELKPHSVLDVGVGFGKYGVLCREYLDLWNGKQEYLKFPTIVDGIEAYKPYITDLHRFIYNKIFLGKALSVIKSLKRTYDLVLLIDVLEHMSKKDGEKLIKDIISKHRGILISTPKNIGCQKDAFGNKFETHLAQWSRSELTHYANTFFISDSESYIAYIGKPVEVRVLQRRFHLKDIKRMLGKNGLLDAVYSLFQRALGLFRSRFRQVRL